MLLPYDNLGDEDELDEDGVDAREEWFDEVESMEIDEGDIPPADTGYGQDPDLADERLDDGTLLGEIGMHIEEVTVEDFERSDTTDEYLQDDEE